MLEVAGQVSESYFLFSFTALTSQAMPTMSAMTTNISPNIRQPRVEMVFVHTDLFSYLNINHIGARFNGRTIKSLFV